MKKFSLLFIFILPLVLTIIVGGNNSFTPEDFQYFCELKGPLKVNTLYQVTLLGRVLSKCTKEYDLRILDQEQNEIPYVILNNQLPEGIETQEYWAKEEKKL